MKQGDFYASSGVTLKEVMYDQATKELKLDIKPEKNVTFQTDFIATLQSKGTDGKQRIGQKVHSSNSLSPSFRMQGNELHVRAVVISTQPHQAPPSKTSFNKRGHNQLAGKTIDAVNAKLLICTNLPTRFKLSSLIPHKIYR